MINDPRFTYHRHLQPISTYDVAFLIRKDTSYGASWKKSEGRSAWFMLLRMMDRLEEMMKPPIMPPEIRTMPLDSHVVQEYVKNHILEIMSAEDIFEKIMVQPRGEDGSVLAVLRDLRRYALLVEAEMVERSIVALEGGGDGRSSVPLEDSNKHADREKAAPDQWKDR